MAIYIDDKELVAAHQAGDTEAFEELVREHRAALFAHGRRKLFCDATAEDAVQETLVRAYRALPKFNGEYRLGPWLHRIMANVCIDEVKRRRRDNEKTEKIASQPITEFGAPSVEEELGFYSDNTGLDKAFQQLPDSYSQALKLRFIDDLDYDEVAEIAGVSEQNARARVSRARVVMRAALKGVAAFPVLLFGILRRGEKAAAAATTGTGAAVTSASATSSSVASQILPSAAPALTEAVVSVGQAAPTAVPAIAKAVVGLGLATAVFVPSSDSALHEAVDSVMAPPVIENTVEENSALLTEVAFESEKNIDTSDGLSIVRTPSAFESTPEGSAASLSEQIPDSKGDLVSGDFESIESGLVSLSQMKLLLDGADRYLAEGTVELSIGESQVEGVLVSETSWLRLVALSDGAAEYRLDGDFFVAPDGDLTQVHLRLSGFAEVGDQGYVLRGLYRVEGDSLEGLSSGFFDGALDHSELTEASHMELRLTP